ncbi:zinc finger MYM-type protein 1-like, partial [Trifolium pratense]
MRKFLVPRACIENVSVVQSEAEVEEAPPNVVNEFNSNEIVRDPGLRKQIYEYALNIQDQVRRAYILKGPTQPILENFPGTQFAREPRIRAFCKSWFKSYTWIEYSEFKDAAYCFHCFLFKQPGRVEHFGYEVFTKGGYKNWKSASNGLKDHVGGHGSMHNSCMKHYDDYNNQRQSIETQGMAFRGHNESLTSLNKGNFREIVDWVKSNNEQVRDAFDRCAKDCTMICSDIQKDFATSCAHEVIK